MADNQNGAWEKFFSTRTKPLKDRFKGLHRAIIVETNDPMNMGRVKIKCPELHDFDLKPEDCPWAVYATKNGGKGGKSLESPCIGDWVFIDFEKGHPYAPIVVGCADPLRRKYYHPSQITIQPILQVNADGKPNNVPESVNDDYLPKDGRPMIKGVIDRYGNADILSSVGYVPAEHRSPPPSPDFDPLTGGYFNNTSNPVVNEPDMKYMLRVTKHGHLFLMSDQGYDWTQEFNGDHDLDRAYELKRWEYIKRLVSEDSNSKDQRRILLQTRYGHKLELRDVGYAQQGPVDNKSRDEYGDPKYLSKENQRDERYIVLSTKLGTQIKLSDAGEQGNGDPDLLDKGDDEFWNGRDSRFLRLNTKHGFKIVLDDRGTSGKSESPRGNGILLKGRRSPAAGNEESFGNQRGFFFEFNEKDRANHSTWGSPLGNVIELNDRYQYVMLASTVGDEFSRPYKGVEENEFIGTPSALKNPESNSHHLKLDNHNEYIRLKTRGGVGFGPRNVVNQSGVNEHQGLEARDGINGDGPWVEVVDSDGRGIWLTKKYGQTLIRGKRNSGTLISLDDDGNVNIYSQQGNVNVNSNNINIKASNSINMESNEFNINSNSIKLRGGSTLLTIDQTLQTNGIFRGRRVEAEILDRPTPGGVAPNNVQAINMPSVIEPTDRGQTYNGPFEECPRSEIENR